MIIKYRTKWAGGYGNWEYDYSYFLKTEKEMNDMLNQGVFAQWVNTLSSNYDYSDKFRGIEYHIIHPESLGKEELLSMWSFLDQKYHAAMETSNFFYTVSNQIFSIYKEKEKENI